MKRTVTIIEDERRTRLFRLPEGSRAEHQQLRKGLMVLGEGDIVVLPSQLSMIPMQRGRPVAAR